MRASKSYQLYMRIYQFRIPSYLAAVNFEACLFRVYCCWLQLWSIYAAGNTVPIPFLRATDISPIALLSGDVLGGFQRDNGGNIAVEAMQELFTGDGQSKKGRSRQNEVLSPSIYIHTRAFDLGFN